MRTLHRPRHAAPRRHPAAALVAASLWLALPGCAQQPAAAPVTPSQPAAAASSPDGDEGRCHAEGAQFAVGQPYSESLAEAARRGAGALHVRRVRVGEMVTMEFDGSRLTLQLDTAGRVSAVRCG